MNEAQFLLPNKAKILLFKKGQFSQQQAQFSFLNEAQHFVPNKA
jgi:hypothetical protein